LFLLALPGRIFRAEQLFLWALPCLIFHAEQQLNDWEERLLRIEEPLSF
jgi:hypothetical protein